MLQINVTIHNEFGHVKRNETVAGIYPDETHGAIPGHVERECD